MNTLATCESGGSCKSDPCGDNEPNGQDVTDANIGWMYDDNSGEFWAYDPIGCTLGK